MTKKCKTDESHGITIISSAVRPFLFPGSGFHSRVPLFLKSFYTRPVSGYNQHSARVLLAGDGPVILQR